MWRGYGLGQQEYQQAYQRQQQHDQAYNLQQHHDRRFNMYQQARGLQQQHDDSYNMQRQYDQRANDHTQAYYLQQQHDQRNENARGPQGGGFGWGRSFHGNRGPSYGFNHGGGGQSMSRRLGRAVVDPSSADKI
ncbi:hypothetical protein LTR91_024659 [Friedmanniomyces endolithicus]|uniref:Uncharacterized protein n=1 Tax=Friedmanniomyces endolithicus TaxID=329885 RepID=A0AAN6H0N9_9PEZI|nr:hypothetical protein LTR94_020002 [Friedmanniomyces endolithicus]KAK0772533.1 hypothetical protein LTR38_016858 [Friedmanniomyces endolithicus]KAK0774913.1 hypothetical protein LTR75_016726 [Friedmanniomyces endolithicus]KAK0797097.1 hypothetical protein LTR59_006942 [Friedmanniomyces endolithicus]KAK0827239.1 hypothetical protein LTR03_016937 [Friedmanniomyces endolithicus]